MAEEVMMTNIKEFIVNSRKSGYPDSKIVESLKNSKWPEDIIQQALEQANQVVASNPEPAAEKTAAAQQPMANAQNSQTSTPQAQQPQQVPTGGQQPAPSSNKQAQQPANAQAGTDAAKQQTTSQAGDQAPKDLFTKPPEGVFPDEDNKNKDENLKKKFSFLSIIALLLSPIPFIGLFFAMYSLDNIKRNNRSGGFLAFFALLINLAIILYLLWLFYNIFTFEDVTQLPSTAQFIADKIGLLG